MLRWARRVISPSTAPSCRRVRMPPNVATVGQRPETASVRPLLSHERALLREKNRARRLARIFRTGICGGTVYVYEGAKRRAGLRRLVGRCGARRVILPATLLFGVGVLSLYFLSAHLWHLYTIFLFMGVVGSGTTAVPYSKVISRWFDRQRGLALGLALVGGSVGIS